MMYSTAPQGVKISGYLFYGAALLYLLGSCTMLGMVGLIVTGPDSDATAIAGVLAFSSCLIFLLTIFYAIIGYGLLQMKPWARIAAIILAILALCNFPLGTIIGGVVLYLLFQPEAQEAFS